MRFYVKYIIAVSCVMLSLQVGAQQAMPFSLVPLQKQININILGSDTVVLGCYNLYGYTYESGIDAVQGEFIVLKDADTFRAKRETQIKFCRVREFAMPAGERCHSIPVDAGIEITHPGQQEKVFLNFDPTMPDAVFIPCK